MVASSDIDFGWEPCALVSQISKVFSEKSRRKKNVTEKNSTLGNRELNLDPGSLISMLIS